MLRAWKSGFSLTSNASPGPFDSDRGGRDPLCLVPDSGLILAGFRSRKDADLPSFFELERSASAFARIRTQPHRRSPLPSWFYLLKTGVVDAMLITEARQR